MKLIIEDDEGRKTVVPLVREEISIGRQEGNTIRLTERNVSRRHARLLRQNNAVYVEDLGSYTGVRVNGEKISARAVVREGDLIEIGDYDLNIEGAPTKAEKHPSPAAHEERTGDRTPPLSSPALGAAPPAPQPRSGPAAKRNEGATAMIRISDIGLSAEPDEERDLRASEQPRLVGLTGSVRGKEFAFRRSVVKIGRTEDNDISIDHQSMSRQHAKFQIEGGAWVAYDSKSANGLRVNGDEYQKSVVKPGDTIELGHLKFRFCAPGEAFTPPREAAATVTASPSRAADDDEPAPKAKTGLIIGIAAGVVVLAIVAVVFVKGGAEGGKEKSGPDAEANCSGAQSAIAAADWDQAVRQLSIVKGIPGGTCSFPIDPALETARLNKEAKASLAEADELLALGKFRQAMALLKGIPPESAYATDAMGRLTDARKAGIRKLVEEAQAALAGGSLADARSAIDDLANLDPDAPALVTLQGSYNDRKRSTAAAAEAKAAAAAAPPKKSMAERNAFAEAKLSEATGLIKGGNIPGGIELLQKVIAEAPDRQFIGKAYRNLGVASARGGKTDDAIKYYKLYLKTVPDAPERAKLEELIASYEKSKN